MTSYLHRLMVILLATAPVVGETRDVPFASQALAEASTVVRPRGMLRYAPVLALFAIGVFGPAMFAQSVALPPSDDVPVGITLDPAAKIKRDKQVESWLLKEFMPSARKLLARTQEGNLRWRDLQAWTVASFGKNLKMDMPFPWPADNDGFVSLNQASDFWTHVLRHALIPQGCIAPIPVREASFRLARILRTGTGHTPEGNNPPVFFIQYVHDNRDAEHLDWIFGSTLIKIGIVLVDPDMRFARLNSEWFDIHRSAVSPPTWNSFGFGTSDVESTSRAPGPSRPSYSHSPYRGHPQSYFLAFEQWVLHSWFQEEDWSHIRDSEYGIENGEEFQHWDDLQMLNRKNSGNWMALGSAVQLDTLAGLLGPNSRLRSYLHEHGEVPPADRVPDLFEVRAELSVLKNSRLHSPMAAEALIRYLKLSLDKGPHAEGAEMLRFLLAEEMGLSDPSLDTWAAYLDKNVQTYADLLNLSDRVIAAASSVWRMEYSAPKIQADPSREFNRPPRRFLFLIDRAA